MHKTPETPTYLLLDTAWPPSVASSVAVVEAGPYLLSDIRPNTLKI